MHLSTLFRNLACIRSAGFTGLGSIESRLVTIRAGIYVDILKKSGDNEMHFSLEYVYHDLGCVP